jgi:hypothetical protein
MNQFVNVLVCKCSNVCFVYTMLMNVCQCISPGLHMNVLVYCCINVKLNYFVSVIGCLFIIMLMSVCQCISPCLHMNVSVYQCVDVFVHVNV